MMGIKQFGRYIIGETCIQVNPVKIIILACMAVGSLCINGSSISSKIHRQNICLLRRIVGFIGIRLQVFRLDGNKYRILVIGRAGKFPVAAIRFMKNCQQVCSGFHIKIRIAECKSVCKMRIGRHRLVFSINGEYK